MSHLAQKGTEMSRSDDDLTLQDAANAQQAASTVDLRPEEIKTLLKLRDAGLIELAGLGELHNENPELTEGTYEEFRRHMVASQGLAPGTADCRVRYIRFLEHHEDAPVSLRPPSEDSWQDHVLLRMENGATGSALNHYRKALKSLLKFLGLGRMGVLEPSVPRA
ncbi:hypothetical protein BRD56_00890 [Thermoplasmatales archaeon SW_10_69_26]|nr:MAG: hypothetical protein BRD56_00890 [Thermoplasmatales archaeon SW_10_69_26]